MLSAGIELSAFSIWEPATRGEVAPCEARSRLAAGALQSVSQPSAGDDAPWTTRPPPPVFGRATAGPLICLCYIRFMVIVDSPMPLETLAAMARETFGDLVKAVVDVETGRMAIGGELHADEEALLLDTGSDQRNLWGINIYPEIEGDDRIEFDSVIYLRPSQGNRSRGVEDAKVRDDIRAIVGRLIAP